MRSEQGKTNNHNLFDKLTVEKIVAIIRGVEDSLADRTLQALAEGGIKFAEVTLNTIGALNMISRFREKYDGQLYIGAGTVINLSMAKEAIAAGAEYIISPNLDEHVIEYAMSQKVDVWPGVMTPTEIVRAYEAGATAVKVFPMGSLGLGYLKEILAPLSHIPMIATGGVHLNNIESFLETGAVAVGLGSHLVDKSLIQAGRFEELSAIAKSFVDKAQA